MPTQGLLAGQEMVILDLLSKVDFLRKAYSTNTSQLHSLPTITLIFFINQLCLQLVVKTPFLAYLTSEYDTNLESV